LCLTSRVFNAEFSHFLYLEVHVQANKIGSARNVVGSPHLARTRKLSMTSPTLQAKELNELVQKMLTKMPSLGAFE
jgi:hypothetical protein